MKYKICFLIIFIFFNFGHLNADILESLIGSYRNHIDIQGTYKGGIYTPPDKDFEFTVPSLVEPGYRINDFMNPNDKSQGYVTFLDDVGQLFRIDFWDNYLNKTQTQRLEELDEEVLITFKKFMNNVQIIKKEKISDDVYFVFYDFPKGSSVLVNEHRINATRGVLFFAKENKIIVLSQQFLESRNDYRNYEKAKNLLLSLKDTNFKFRSMIRNDIQDSNEQLMIGYKYLEAKQFPEARYWIEKSALQGNAIAEWTFGLMFLRGDGVYRDYTNAKKWFEKSSSQGNVNATYDLAAMYNNGEGIQKDISIAKQLFIKCANIAHKESIKELIKIYKKEDNKKEEEYWMEKLSKI
ncbi:MULTISPECIES: tetratricopeptide repeat protein [unclassified Sulfuricurvum]|uniref:tetratricopeptide repeat protein n=1 Tax=unclassified Sulfuricurvum TaxID=2632390 RepID=UPI0002999FC2|nr:MULTISPECIES: tetratricopeptide repeat protein [unclassified Sulfuricurvum]AFV97226.1 Sel1 domain-containing protein [Candidatus Sulfuricurvum sp. RIFRC-1]OHD88776.1 MAG: hypothetical protein A3G19_09370 [Sulfuricurvum sp. RIFCSPLOWO2_12_FULL_43_24]HBM34876.1 sel1 repeat family protein [Sulfuricurvum sp.]